MSYPVPPAPVPPFADGGTGAAPRRPLPVQFAAILLVLMALAGLGYAITTLAVTPGVVDRFRSGAGDGPTTEIDGYVTVVWLFAALGTVLAVILFALYVVLALGLRRGSHGMRIATWVICGLGILFGCGAIVATAVQRSGSATPGTLNAALVDAYPSAWITANVGLAIAQVVGYLVVALLLFLSPGEFFGRSAQAGNSGAPGAVGPYVTLPTYGSANQPGVAPPSAFGAAQQAGAQLPYATASPSYVPSPFATPSAPAGSQFAAPSAPAGPSQFAVPPAPAGSQFAAPSGPVGPSQFAPPSASAGPSQFGVPPAAPGPSPFAVPPAPAGPPPPATPAGPPSSAGQPSFPAPPAASPSVAASPVPAGPPPYLGAPAAPPPSAVSPPPSVAPGSPGAVGSPAAPDPTSGTSAPATSPPTPGPDDDYWARPSG